MSRVVALLVVSLLPGAPLSTASCLVACSMESTAVAGTCHEQHETPWNSSASVVAGESGCDWVASAPPYVREDRRQPEPSMKAFGLAGALHPTPARLTVHVGVRYESTEGLLVRRMSSVLRL